MNESTVEQATLEWLAAMGYATVAGEAAAERDDCRQVDEPAARAPTVIQFGSSPRRPPVRPAPRISG
jgi:hypothetical protein